MASSYPSSIKSFTNRVDLVDTIYAGHINSLQDEVRAIEYSLGTGILASTYTGSFSQTSSWTNLSDRLANIEKGMVNGVAGSPYFLRTGDTVTAAVGQVGLTVRSPSGGTANVLEARTSSNTLGFRVDYQGIPYVGTGAVLYVGNAQYNTIMTAINTPPTFPDIVSPFLLAGM